MKTRFNSRWRGTDYHADGSTVCAAIYWDSYSAERETACNTSYREFWV